MLPISSQIQLNSAAFVKIIYSKLKKKTVTFPVKNEFLKKSTHSVT